MSREQAMDRYNYFEWPQGRAVAPASHVVCVAITVGCSWRYADGFNRRYGTATALSVPKYSPSSLLVPFSLL